MEESEAYEAEGSLGKVESIDRWPKTLIGGVCDFEIILRNTIEMITALRE